MRINKLIALFSVLAVLRAGTALAEPFDQALFDSWIEARVGSGDPVYWYSIGTVRAYPSGDLLFNMEGYDTARVHRPDAETGLAHQYNRKVYVFRDPDTNEVITEWNGEAVEPIAYPYQFISYELKDGEVETFVEQGAGERVSRMGPGRDIKVRRLGDSLVFTAPVYLDFPIPGTEARYQAFENYDFFIHPGSAVEVPNQLSWMRYGACPRWTGGVPCVMHLITWRVDSYGAVPQTLRGWIDSEAPLWRKPPADLDEIRELQAGR